MPQENPEFGEPEFLGWALLRKLKDQSDNQISRSKFLKLCCIADRRLLEMHEYDIGFPRYWYMYGELANEHEFSGRFYNAPQAIGWEGQQYLPKPSITNVDISQEGIELINRAVRWTVKEFGRKNVEEIKKYQYRENAENDFIREYSELRWLLNTIDLGRQERLPNYVNAQSNGEYLKSKLNTMMTTYPDDEEHYSEMKGLFLRWDDTVRIMIEQSIEYSRIAEFLDDFIRALSKVVLRFAYNQNISEQRLANWQEDAAKEKSEFTTNLKNTRMELLSNRSQSTELDSVSEDYSQTIEEKIEQVLARQ